jgi:hypothetical protein
MPVGITLPQWLVQIGSLAGLGTLAFTLVDRIFSARPMVSVRPWSQTRDIYCFNPSKEDLLIRSIRVYPRSIIVAKGDTPREMAAALAGETFSIFLKPQTASYCPLVVKKGELINPDSTSIALFAIWVSWRRARSMWLPQIPVIYFFSARSLRRLSKVKMGKTLDQ